MSKILTIKQGYSNAITLAVNDKQLLFKLLSVLEEAESVCSRYNGTDTVYQPDEKIEFTIETAEVMPKDEIEKMVSEAAIEAGSEA